MASSTHPLHGMKPKDKKTFDKDSALKKCTEWLTDVVGKKNCVHLSSRTESSCDCMKEFFICGIATDATLASLAAYIVHWATLQRQTQMELLHEWKKSAEFVEGCIGNRVDDVLDEQKRFARFYRVPGGVETFDHTICKNALCRMLGVGRKLWSTSMKSADERIHGAKGKIDHVSSRGKEMREVNLSLDSFFDLLKDEALPFATRIIRDEVGMSARDDDPDDVLLPPNITKRGCYVRWCYSRGWKVQFKGTGRSILKSPDDYEKRPVEALLWPPESEYKKVISWTKFHRYWKVKQPHLKIRAKGADTCTDCLILRNEFRTMAPARRAIAAAAASQSALTAVDGRDDDGSSGSDTMSEAEESKDENENKNEAEFERMVTTMQGKMIEAKAHVRAYQVQREESKKIISLARSDISNLLPSIFRNRVLTIDMGQNLNLPNFEGEQPGDTFYLSPLTVLLFGVVDNATESKKDHMKAYIWQEFEGERGANNIASCLMKDLQLRGLFSQPNHGRLTYIADNCGGQNKNKIVIRFLMWLVENKIFPVVRILFLVKGHTKNSADRCFNLLKNSYHRTNIYTYDELHDVLNKNEHVTVHKMGKEDFFDHQTWQDTMYRAPAGGEFKQSHVFTIYGNGMGGHMPTTLVKQDTIEAAIRTDDLLPTRRNKKADMFSAEERARRIARMAKDLKNLQPNGLRPIKQVELWKKWGPLLPEAARKITCPKPSDEVIESIKLSNREKTKTRKNMKRKRKETAIEMASKGSKKVPEDAD